MKNIFTTWYLRINHPLFDFHNIYLFRSRIYPALSLSPSLSLLSQASWSFIASLLCMLQSLYRANKSCSFWIVCFVCCHCCSYCSHLSLSLPLCCFVQNHLHDIVTPVYLVRSFSVAFPLCAVYLLLSSKRYYTLALIPNNGESLFMRRGKCDQPAHIGSERSNISTALTCSIKFK